MTTENVRSLIGKRIYFPSKGILSQSGEAKTLAKKFNATIGTALSNHQAMCLPCVNAKVTSIRCS